MANIFYVDPINGSNDNDGTTPDTAWADPFVELTEDQSTADAPALIYVRRNTSAELGAINITTNINRIIIGWPTEEDEYYDTRPTAGTDAGWDNDDAVKPKFTFTSTIEARVTVNNILKFYNLNLETSDDGGDFFILYSIGNLGFYNCDIDHQRNDSGDSFAEFRRVDKTKGQMILEVENCNITFDGMLFGSKADETWSECSWDITINNSTLNNTDAANAVVYCRASGIYNTLNINNSIITLSSTRLYYMDEDNYVFAKATLNISNSTITTGQDLVYCRSRYKFTATVEDSFVRFGDNMFEIIHYNDVGESYKTDIFISNTVIENGNRVLWMNNNYYNDKNCAFGDFIIKDCKINLNYELIRNADDLNVYTKEFSISNTELNCTRIFTSDDFVKGFAAFIDLKNSNIRDCCFRYYSGTAYVIASNSSFNQLSIDSNPGNCQYILNNCNIVAGTQNNDTIIINGGSIGGDLDSCYLDATNVQANIDERITGFIKNSSISSLPAKANGMLEIFSCTANDEPIPYAKLTPNFKLAPSNILRVNGGDGSMQLSAITMLPGFSIDRIKLARPAGKNKVNFYVASQNTDTENFTYKAAIYYEIDGTGYTLTTPLVEAIEIPDEEWSGLYNGYHSYKITFDLPDLGDSNVDVVFSIQGLAKDIKLIPPLYFDLVAVWE